MTPGDAQKLIVKYFGDKKVRGKKLDFAHSPLDRHRGFFGSRRAAIISSLPANAAMLSDPNLITLKARIDNEFAQLDAFLEDKVKALRPGGTDKTPTHLDLKDLAQPKINTPTATIKDNEQKYRAKRDDRVRAIGWRAAAIHEELWKASADGTTATLQADALHQVIDRRLHMVERMNFQISRAEALGGSWSFTGGGVNGPWKDGFRVRMFEYPRIPRSVMPQAEGFIGDANIAAPTHAPFDSHDPPWLWEPGKHRLLYNVGPSPGVQMALRVRSDWSVDTQWSYFRDLTPDASNTPAVVFDRMFTVDPDWWGRSWLFCDHVISALHLEALLFGLRRRNPTGGENEFNGLVKQFPNIPGFVSIGNFVAVEGSRKLGRLMAMESTDPLSNLGADPYFENGAISEDDLQIGDHLIFYNSRIFGLISSSEWSLENSVVINVDSSLDGTGGIRRSELYLQGHGTSEKIYSEYLKEVVSPLDEALGHVRNAIQNAVSTDPTKTELNWMSTKPRLVRWDPYERFPSPGAWWIRVEPDSITTLAELQAMLPGTIIQDPTPGPGYAPPPTANAVYFPLYRPKFRNFWTGYLDARRTNGSLRAPKLEAYAADASITPGIFWSGSKKPLPVLRPKVIP